jgi:lactate permease
MTLGTQVLLAVFPIFLAGVLLVGFRIPARWAMPLVYVTAVVIALTAWQMETVIVAAASIQGLFLTFDLLFIIFGALLLLNTLEQSGGVAQIRDSFHGISDDRRVQIVIIAWLFGSFIEGAAGFGTPAAIAAPLMVAMGFPAAAAVMIGMMIQSTAVTFGAAGTPVLVGVQGGVGGAVFDAHMAAAGLDMRTFLEMVAARAVILHGIAGTLMPTFMVVMTTRFFGANRSWTEGLSIVPFALFGGLAFTIPYSLTGVFLGPEFPSLLGAPVGLALVTLAARRGFLVPDDSWDFPDTGRWPEEWVSGMEVKDESSIGRKPMSTARAWSPYLLLAVLLALSRVPQLPLGGWLQSLRIAWHGILGTEISGATAPLYLPGAILVVVVIVTFFLHRMEWSALARAVKDSSSVLLGAGFVLVFTVPMVRVYINSGVNAAGLMSMPIAMAEWIAVNVGRVWPMFAGVTGALGAFIAGSNTVSNLMFSAFQYGVAERLAISGLMILALQAVGAAAGNMVAIHNVVAASATVGLLGREGSTLRKTIVPTIYYLTVIGILGLLAIYVLAIPDRLMEASRAITAGG